ncbi:hypothetical protein ACFLW5_00995 [Chloroflexota bacterium]
MEFSVFFSMWLGYLIGAAPALVFWIVIIIFATVMLRRGGDRAERFLIAGASLKIVSNLLSIPAVAIVPWLVDRGYNTTDAVSWRSGYGIFCNVISMAGIICLIYAFWVKFKAGKAELVESTN